MNNQEEKYFLTKLLDKLDNPESLKPHSKLNLLLVWVIVTVLVVLLLQLEQRGMINPIIMIASSLLVGAFIGWLFTTDLGKKQWRHVHSHINKDSVKKRLEEI
ncbi:hypothetical protein HR060_18380 [Catenovulum sp. SM1970]|uniref:hypothetical protein n=1 Tax=Marinifaba aquimaris TaxID=2741323 RepID=UPI0015721DF4|nr:hypothetical protein [Marinifaba aquimaris]NTS78812.1 hypothetical protein [Marinifaba aquimaris]